MSNNKKGKSLRKILTSAYTAILIGASGMVVADTLFISKSLAKFSNETAAATNTATGRAQAARERRGTRIIQAAQVAQEPLQRQP